MPVWSPHGYPLGHAEDRRRRFRIKPFAVSTCQYVQYCTVHTTGDGRWSERRSSGACGACGAVGASTALRGDERAGPGCRSDNPKTSSAATEFGAAVRNASFVRCALRLPTRSLLLASSRPDHRTGNRGQSSQLQSAAGILFVFLFASSVLRALASSPLVHIPPHSPAQHHARTSRSASLSLPQRIDLTDLTV